MSISRHSKPAQFAVTLVSVLLVGALAATFFAMPAQSGPPRYVAPGGVDAGDCSSPGAPCATWTYAAAQADPGDTIRVMEGAYPEHAVITQSVTIEGDYDATWTRYPVRDPGRTVLDGGGTARSLTIEGPGLEVYLDGFRVTGGNASTTFPHPDYGGGILVSEAVLHGIDLRIDHNVATTDGSSGWGGGLAVRDGAAYLTGTLIVSNTAKTAGSGFGYGGGLYVGGAAGAGQAVLHMVDCQVQYNVAGSSTTMSDAVGGGLAMRGADTTRLFLQGNTWSYNTARAATAPAGNGRGGGISVDTVGDPVEVTIQGDILEGNTANASPGTGPTQFSQGGGIYFYGNYVSPNISATLSQVTLAGNIAQADGPGMSRGQGGGLFAQGVNLVIQDSTLAGNTAGLATVDDKRAQGGGIYLFGTTLTAERLFVHDNIALDGNGSGEPLYESAGGGIALLGGGAELCLQNSFLVDNDVSHTGGHGAGIYVGPSSTARIAYVTIAHADGSLQQGLYAGSLGSTADVVVTDTIIVSHTIGIQNDDTFDERVYARYILFFGNMTNTVGPIGGEEGYVFGSPAFVQPAGRNYHLLGTSAAINAALDIGVYTDYDGDTRPQQGGFDIGADEYTAGGPTPTPVPPTATPEPPTATPEPPTPTSTPGATATATPTPTPVPPTPTPVPGPSPTPSPPPENEVFLPIVSR